MVRELLDAANVL